MRRASTRSGSAMAPARWLNGIRTLLPLGEDFSPRRNNRITHARRTSTRPFAFSPPPCGERSGVGVVRYGTGVPERTTPTPALPTRGRRKEEAPGLLQGLSLLQSRLLEHTAGPGEAV